MDGFVNSMAEALVFNNKYIPLMDEAPQCILSTQDLMCIGILRGPFLVAEMV